MEYVQTEGNSHTLKYLALVLDKGNTVTAILNFPYLAFRVTFNGLLYLVKWKIYFK